MRKSLLDYMEAIADAIRANDLNEMSNQFAELAKEPHGPHENPIKLVANSFTAYSAATRTQNLAAFKALIEKGLDQMDCISEAASQWKADDAASQAILAEAVKFRGGSSHYLVTAFIRAFDQNNLPVFEQLLPALANNLSSWTDPMDIIGHILQRSNDAWEPEKTSSPERNQMVQKLYTLAHEIDPKSAAALESPLCRKALRYADEELLQALVAVGMKINCTPFGLRTLSPVSVATLAHVLDVGTLTPQQALDHMIQKQWLESPIMFALEKGAQITPDHLRQVATHEKTQQEKYKDEPLVSPGYVGLERLLELYVAQQAKGHAPDSALSTAPKLTTTTKSAEIA